MKGRLTPRIAFVSFLIGVLMVQLSWALALPAFRGIDEFDHIYRSAAVARGDFVPASGVAESGRGGRLVVPGDIVDAAHDVCSWYKYTLPDNCTAITTLPNGEVTIASGAANYNPAYYAIAGTAALPFRGDAAVHAMRAVTALISALLIAWGAALIARWSQTKWPLAALAIALTPMLIFSTAIATPNGVGYAAAVLVWSALLTMGGRSEPHRDIQAWIALTLGSIALLTTHATGPMWLAVILVLSLCTRSPRFWFQSMNQNRLSAATSIVVVGATTAFSIGWTRHTGQSSIGVPMKDVDPMKLIGLIGQIALWPLQTLGAFPLRGDQAPLPFYALGIIAPVALIVLALRVGSRNLRSVLLVLILLDFAVPAILTTISYSYQGWAWQGRYSLPLTVGVFLLAGAVLDRGRQLHAREIAVLIGLLTSIATIAVLDLGLEEAGSVAPGLPLMSSIPGGAALVALLAISGTALPLVMLIRTTPDRDGAATT